MSRLDSHEICKLLDIVIGETEPVADSAIDEKREDNLKTLIDIGDWILDGLYQVAEHRHDAEFSSRMVGDRAYAVMLDWKEWLSEKEVLLA